MKDFCPFCKSKFENSYNGTDYCIQCKMAIDDNHIAFREDDEYYNISHIDDTYKLIYNKCYYKQNDTVLYFKYNEIFDIFKYKSKHEYIENIKKIMVFA